MTPAAGDHLLALFLTALVPVDATLPWTRRLRPHMESGGTAARPQVVQRQTRIEQWLLAAALLAWWFRGGRSALQEGE